MRKGRPCSCGCITCHGFPCEGSSDTRLCNDSITYADFADEFVGPLASGWDFNNFGIDSGTERGIHSSGDYTYDSVTGTTSLRDPIRCARFDLSNTFYYNANTGFGQLGIENGPELWLENQDVFLILPNGSSELIDSTFRTGDNYRILYSITKKPSGLNHDVNITKRRNGNTQQSSSWCNGGGPVSHTVPYTGCPYSICELYDNTFLDPSGYTITDPPKSFVAISGDWEIDDYCWKGFEWGRSKLLGQFTGNSEYCDRTCDYTARPAYRYINYGGLCSNVPPASSTNTIYYWGAYLDAYVKNESDIRCGVPPLDTGVFVYIETDIPNLEQDLLAADIWNIFPYRAYQEVSCQDSSILDENCSWTYFKGVPCIDGCLQPAFLTLDDTYFTNSNAFYYDISCTGFGDPYESGCLHIGNVSIGDLTNNQDKICGHLSSQCTNGYSIDEINNVGLPLLVFPRNDRLSYIRYTVPLGCAEPEDYSYLGTASIPPFYDVDKRGYKINWDEDAGWWTGTINFLNGSGTQVSGSDKDDHVNFGDIYQPACDQYEIYIYDECFNASKAIIELYKDGQLYFSDYLKYNDMDGGTATDTTIIKSMPFNTLDPSDNYGNVLSIFRQNYSFDGDETCPSSACFAPSGTYDLDLQAMCGYNCAGYPPYFIGDGGEGISRNLNVINSTAFSAPKRGFWFNPATVPSPGSCLAVATKSIVYEMGTGTPTLKFATGVKPQIATYDSCSVEEGTNIALWSGRCAARFIEVGTPEVLGGAAMTFAWDDYPVDDDDNGGYIVNCDMYVFYDTVNTKFRAKMVVIGEDPYEEQFEIDAAAAGWSDISSRFWRNIKTQSDILNDNYFANVEVLSSSPYHFRITQTVFSISNISDPYEPCIQEYLNKYLIIAHLHEPTYGAV